MPLGFPQSDDRELSAEWIDDENAFNFPAICHVFAVKLAAPERAGRRDDRAIPIGKSMTQLDIERSGENRRRDVLDGESHPGTNEPAAISCGSGSGRVTRVAWT